MPNNRGDITTRIFVVINTIFNIFIGSTIVTDKLDAIFERVIAIIENLIKLNVLQSILMYIVFTVVIILININVAKIKKSKVIENFFKILVILVTIVKLMLCIITSKGVGWCVFECSNILFVALLVVLHIMSVHSNINIMQGTSNYIRFIQSKSIYTNLVICSSFITTFIYSVMFIVYTGIELNIY